MGIVFDFGSLPRTVPTEGRRLKMKAWWMARGIPMVLCALMPSAACGLLQAYVQKYLDPASAAVIYTLESVITCAVSILMGFERLSLRLVLGGGLIIGAVLLAQLPLPGKNKKEKEEV